MKKFYITFIVIAVIVAIVIAVRFYIPENKCINKQDNLSLVMHNDSIVHIGQDERLSESYRCEVLGTLSDSLTKEESFLTGDAYFNMWKFPEAIKYYKMALSACSDVNLENDTAFYEIVVLCHNIAVSYLWLEKNVYAMYYLERARGYIEKRYGTEDTQDSSFLHTILIDRHCMLAHRLDRKLCYKYDRKMSDQIPSFIMYDMETDIATLLDLKDNVDTLFSRCQQLHNYYKNYYRHYIVSSPYEVFRYANSEIDIESEVDEYKICNSQMQTAVDRYPTPVMDSLLYDMHLFQKDLVLNTHKRVMTEPLNLAAGLITLLSNSYYNDALVTADYWKRDSLFKKIDYFQNLIYSNVSYKSADSINNITIDSVRKSLSPDAVAIEFGSFNEFDDFRLSDDKSYYALLLQKESPYPVYIPLFNDTDVDKNNYNWTVKGKPIADVVWNPILSRLKGIKSIYFAPSGELNVIPIENLPMSTGECVADLYEVYRVSSTGVITEKSVDAKPDEAHIFGGVENTEHKYLEGSEAEAIDVACVLTIGGVSDVNLYLGKEASDFTLRSIITEHNKILHFATHSFYYSDEAAKASGFYKGKEYILDWADPMVRCGIVLSPDKVYNVISPLSGVLTASQITNFDFFNCSLLVLSSCGSGLGDVKSEGVYGLSRAFRMAGAKTVVMSLWDIDDKATTIFMSAFYEALASGWNKHKAFNTARRTLRNTPGYSSHLYWASFIMLD